MDWGAVALCFKDRFEPAEIENARRCLVGSYRMFSEQGMPWRPNNGKPYLETLRAALVAMGELQ